MSCATRSGRVAGERAAGAAEPVVERDGGGECGEAHGDAHEEVVQGACAVAFEAELVLQRPDDGLNTLAQPALFTCQSRITNGMSRRAVTSAGLPVLDLVTGLHAGVLTA